MGPPGAKTNGGWVSGQGKGPSQREGLAPKSGGITQEPERPGQVPPSGKRNPVSRQEHWRRNSSDWGQGQAGDKTHCSSCREGCSQAALAKARAAVSPAPL